MKLFLISIILIIFQSCSFDNKTGIWKNSNTVFEKEEGVFKEFETLSTSNKIFDKIINIDNKFKFVVPNPIINSNWSDIYYNETNNLNNFKYNDLGKLTFRSKKVSKSKTDHLLLFTNNNIITSDQKGNIIIFSINENKIITKFNFYKKKYKKIKKILNLIVDDYVIYVSDNLGYLYAYDYNKNKLLWAKNYKVPFRSNLKIFKQKLIAANQSNNLLFFDKASGKNLKSIPSEETTIKNDFVNSLSLNNENLFFLNTYGSLYSIDSISMKINWFINLNRSLDLNPNNLFKGNQVINNQNVVVVTTNQFTYIIDSKTGSIIYKKNFTSLIKPLIINDYLFLVTKNDLLVAVDLSDGDVIYSYDINQKIAEYLNTKKKTVQYKDIMMINSEIYIFLKNSYLLKFNIEGDLLKVNKLKSKINSQPLVIDNSILYLDNKSKISIMN
jgi:outer membrane protein assembly factor BamB